jgi:hypothetical protein
MKQGSVVSAWENDSFMVTKIVKKWQIGQHKSTNMVKKMGIDHARASALALVRHQDVWREMQP